MRRFLEKTRFRATSAKKDILEKIVSPLLDCKPVDDNAFNPTSANALIEEQVPLETLNSAFKELPQKLVEIDAAAFAQELTLIDKEHFLSISWHELSTCGWMKKDKHVRSPNVMDNVAFFNRISNLVASQILAEETAWARARVVSKAIQIADKCCTLGNFNSLKAVLSSLQSSPIHRLKKTWKKVPARRKRKFRNLARLMCETDNFDRYRAKLASRGTSGPCLPFLGDFLTQIAQHDSYSVCKQKGRKHCEEIGNEHESETGDKQSEKDRQLEPKLWKIQLSAILYEFPNKPDIYARCFLHNASFNTEKENYTLSLQREPCKTT